MLVYKDKEYLQYKQEIFAKEHKFCLFASAIGCLGSHSMAIAYLIAYLPYSLISKLSRKCFCFLTLSLLAIKFSHKLIRLIWGVVRFLLRSKIMVSLYLA